MAVTVQQVYDAAMVLIDEVAEDGTIQSSSPEYYQTKTFHILTNLQTELLDPSITPQVFSSLNDTFLVSDRVALLILPYGVAAELLLADRAYVEAQFYNARYDELKGRMPKDIEGITDNYDVLSGMQ